MKFNFTGNLLATLDQEKKGYFYRHAATKAGKPYSRINLRVSAAQNNNAFVELFGMEGEIKTKDNNNGDISIAWEDRNDSDVVSAVASYRKFNILGNTYIAPMDVCEFIKENIDEIKDGKYCVTGDIGLNEYNGKFSDQYTIKNIYTVEDDRKADLVVYGDFFYATDSFDDSDWKADKKLYINGWTSEWFKKSETEKGNYFYPRQLVFDCSRIDFDNKDQAGRVIWILKQLGCESKNGTIKCKLDKKKVYQIPVKCRYFNGAEEIPFSEDELTENQKEAIKLGVMTLDDCRPKDKRIFGNRVVEWRLFNFDISGDYSDGAVEAAVTKAELEEQELRPHTEESFDDAMNAPEEPEEKSADKVSIDDLF